MPFVCNTWCGVCLSAWSLTHIPTLPVSLNVSNKSDMFMLNYKSNFILYLSLGSVFWVIFWKKETSGLFFKCNEKFKTYSNPFFSP